VYRYTGRINGVESAAIWSCVESIYRLVEFIEDNDLELFSQARIILIAGTLSKYARETTERVFDMAVHNRYRPWEVSDSAFEWNEQDHPQLISVILLEIKKLVQEIDAAGKKVYSKGIVSRSETISSCLLPTLPERRSY